MATRDDVGDGALVRIAKGDAKKIAGFLSDYADLANAALDVYEASFRREWLELASELASAAEARFCEDGRWYAASASADLIARTEDVQDNAVPSGASAIARVAPRLGAHGRTDRDAVASLL